MDAERHQEIARCLFRESNDALFLFDPADHRVLDLNPAAMRLTGFARDRACAMTVWDLFRGDGPRGIEELIEAYRRTGFYHARDGFVLNCDRGASIPVNVSVSRIHTLPDPLGLVVVRDQSERVRAEAALRDSERRYRLLVETARVLIWTASADGRMTSLNPQFRAMTGRLDEEWIGRRLPDLVRPEDREAAEALIAGALSGESPPPVDLRILGAEGTVLTLEFLSTSRLDPSPSAAISGIARDVTAARKTAEAVRQAEVAEAADRAKSQFLAQVSHEIRTPMTAILGSTQLILDDPRTTEFPTDRQDDLRTIAQSGAHLLALIDDILDISRIEAGKLKVELSDCSAAGIASQVVTALRSRAEAKGLQLALSFANPIPETISTDPVRLRQILINLVGNAVKFTESGSVNVVLSLDEELGEVAFEVQDTGPGISEEERARLFEPFSRPVRPAQGGANGTGLGLAISRRLASLLGGTIEVTSTPRRGSSFLLRMPAGRAIGNRLVSVPAEARSVPGLSGHGGQLPPLRGRILLAEDNPAILKVTHLRLQAAGAEVVTARNGQEALARVEESQAAGRPFHAILMDMQMPVMDGYEATRLLRGRGFRGFLVALTAYAMTEDRDECLRLGCDAHVSKPIDWTRLGTLLSDRLTATP